MCWKISAITAIACLLLAKLLTVCVLRIDVNCMKSYTCLGGGRSVLHGHLSALL